MESDEKELESAVAELATKLDQLIAILVGKGVLNEGHQRILDKVARLAGRQRRRSTVRLAMYVDKYTVENSDIDCDARMPLCRGRCCTYNVELSAQDLEEGTVRWELDEPYMLRHEQDGRCTHQDRTTLGCTIYEHRPATCRSFSCKEDRRIWIDFENRIPAP